MYVRPVKDNTEILRLVEEAYKVLGTRTPNSKEYLDYVNNRETA